MGPVASPAATFHERYIPALDGIRGIAILAVLLHHARYLLNPAFGVEQGLIKLLELGWCGVGLFFVLSGFLITGILLDTRSSPNYFHTFYARRFLRIFPLYYGFLAATFVGSHYLHRMFAMPDPLSNISPWWYLAYLQNLRPVTTLLDPYLGALWSLAVEEQFYLVWPLLVLLLNRKALTAVCVCLIPLSLIIRFHYSGVGGAQSTFVNTFTPASLDQLAAGALLAIALRDPVWRDRAARLARPLTLASAAWFCILAARSRSLFEYAPLIQSWGITALTLAFAGLISVAITSPDGALSRLLQLPALRFTGKISYSLYVLHPVVFAVAIPALAAVPVTAPLDLALSLEKIVLVLLASLVVAAASWFYFEKPILELKKYFPYKQPREFVRASAASANAAD